MQVFQKHDAYLGGMDEAIAILKLCAEDFEALDVHALYDGERIEPYETVLTIEGDTRRSRISRPSIWGRSRVGR